MTERTGPTVTAPDCGLCVHRPDFELVVFESLRVIAPRRLHNAGTDGGHLIVLPRRHVLTRWDLEFSEVAAMHVLSYVCKVALERSCGATWWNLQENGNWGLSRPSGPHMHLHVYGRRRDSVRQPYGEALVLPKRDDQSAEVSWYSTAQWASLLDTFSLLDERKLSDARDLLSKGAARWMEQVVPMLGDSP